MRPSGQRPEPDLTHKVPYIQYGPRLIRFEERVIEDLRQTFMVRTPADARRVADGRRKACADSAGAP